MTKPGYGRLGLVVCTSLAVAGCQMGAGGGKAGAIVGADATGAGTASAVTLVERDVEAPDVFQVSDKGLWDGRPSLGGVWVAHASVTDPERVMIRNTANGKFVVGALFKREFDNPGPTLQVSSDAAEALGMLAGQPQVLNVVALKREELPDGGVPADPDAALAGGDPVIGDKVNDAGSAVAAASPVVTPAPKPATAGDDGAEVAAATTAALAAKPSAAEATAQDATVPVLPDAAEPPRKKRWWPFGKRAAAPAVAEAPTAGPDDAAVAATIAPGAIDATPLTPAAGTGLVGAAADKDPVTAVPAAAAAPANTLKRAYIQIGIFSQEANAAKAAKQMKGAGLAATVKPDQSGGKPFWRVIIGPAASEGERTAFAARVKGLGYPDAYPVTK